MLRSEYSCVHTSRPKNIVVTRVLDNYDIVTTTNGINVPDLIVIVHQGAV